MELFHNDYNQLCHPAVMAKMQNCASEQQPGYSEDTHCKIAAEKIRKICGNENVAVHFLVGGTQTNLTVIVSSLRPHQGVLCADTAHINVHETGAIEATGHKVITLPTKDGKISAADIREFVQLHRTSADAEHMAQPKMVYISNPTELGTIYYLNELQEVSNTCRELGLYLFVDGARLGYGLTAADNDVTLTDLTALCDVFYIGGTKVGAMFGEAVVIPNPVIAEDFRYLIKQRGAMLAKGWTLGVQFDALFENDLYFEISRHANVCAEKIRKTLTAMNIPMLVQTTTNQLFPIMSDEVLDELGKSFTFTEMGRIDATHRAIRFCTSWATSADSVDRLCDKLAKLVEK